MDSLTPLKVVAFSFCTVLTSEILQWFFIYRTREFKNIQANLEKHSAKVEAASQDRTSKSLKKKEARMEKWKEDASKFVTAMNFKTGLLTVVTFVTSLRFATSMFSGLSAAHLPFEPPPFLQKVTHRGLTGADPKECSAMFIFMLAQGTFKVLLAKVLNWGPSREMKKIKPWVPKELRDEFQ